VCQEVRIKKKMVKEQKGIKESIYIDTRIIAHLYQSHHEASFSSIKHESRA